MTLLERLKYHHETGDGNAHVTCGEAAAEIERLYGLVAEDTGRWQDLWKGERAANDRLRAVLEHIVRECGAINKGPVAVALARAALEYPMARTEVVVQQA